MGGSFLFNLHFGTRIFGMEKTMNYLVPYDPPDKEEGFLPAIIKTGQRAMSTVPGARWVFKVLDHLYRQVTSLVAAYRYRRQNRADFHQIMHGWHTSDTRSQCAYRFCMRAYSLITDSERRDQFVMAVVAFAQTNTQQAIEFFAEREREYIEVYFADFSITFT
jgi:hypothetical protein